MTISSETTKVQFDTDGVEDEFETGFRVLQEEDLEVIFRNADGDETVYVLNTDYTVSLDPDNNNATITCTSPPANGGIISLRRTTEQVQETDLTAQGPLPAETIEAALDKLTMQVQELQEQIDRVTLSSIIELEAEPPAPEALYVMTGTTLPSADSVSEGQLMFLTGSHYLYMCTMTASVKEWTRIGQVLKDPPTSQFNLGYLPLMGGSNFAMTGPLNMGNGVTNQRIVQLQNPVNPQDAATKNYTDTYFVPKAGGVTITGDISLNSTERITNCIDPASAQDVATKNYVDVTHTHNGTLGAKIEATNLKATGASNGTIAFCNSAVISMVAPWAVDFEADPHTLIGTGYGDVCEVTLSLPAATTRLWVHFTMQGVNTEDYDIKILNGADATIVEDTSWYTAVTNTQGVFDYVYTPATTGSYTVTAQLKAGHAGTTEANAFLAVFMC